MWGNMLRWPLLAGLRGEGEVEDEADGKVPASDPVQHQEMRRMNWMVGWQA